MAKHLSGGPRRPPNALVRGLARLEGWVDAPPTWVRIAYPATLLLVVADFWQQRGWVGGVAATGRVVCAGCV